MSTPFNLNISGLEELKARLSKIKEVTQKEIVQEIQASGEVIRGAASVRVPVDTGFLKNKITVRKIENGVEDVAQTDYAAYVEFGTGTKVSVPKGLEDYAIQFKGAGEREVNLPAQPFMFPSYFEEKPKLLKRIKEKLDKA